MRDDVDAVRIVAEVRHGGRRFRLTQAAVWHLVEVALDVGATWNVDAPLDTERSARMDELVSELLELLETLERR